MAKETITKLIDDLDGSAADETVKFGLDGYAYEIDLSAKNAAKLRKALGEYVAKGSRVDTQQRAVTAGRGRGASARRRGGTAVGREQNKAIRTWAERKGIQVAPRGRIKAEIVERYQREAGR